MIPSVSTRPAPPHLSSLSPRAAIPGGTFEVLGTDLMLSADDGSQLPTAAFGEMAASLDLVRPTRAVVRVPEGTIASDLTISLEGRPSNVLHANVAVSMAENLHLISNPAVDARGNLYAMVSGPRGERVPVSIFRVDRDLQVRAFARDLLNISALALDPDGFLYASSRSEGIVYRISPEGEITPFAEGMGVATGLAFDRDANLFVGDRSGTIFKIARGGAGAEGKAGEIFVFATLEPSVAAYHLAFRDDGSLLVTAPNTSSNQAIYSITPRGDTSVFYRGLGRPQGMALDEEGSVYVAASLHGQRGIVRITADGQHAEALLSGNDLVGLCFLDDGCAAIAAANTLYHVDLGITGRPLV